MSTQTDNCAKGRNGSFFCERRLSSVQVGEHPQRLPTRWNEFLSSGSSVFSSLFLSFLFYSFLFLFGSTSKHNVLHTLLTLLAMSCGGTTGTVCWVSSQWRLAQAFEVCVSDSPAFCLLSNADLTRARTVRGRGQMAAWGDTKRPRRARWRRGKMQSCAAAAAQQQGRRAAALPPPAATNPLPIRLGLSTDESLILSKPGARPRQEAAVFCRRRQMRWFVNVAAPGYINNTGVHLT